MKEELAAGLSKRQIAEFVEHDEVHAGEVVGEPPLPTGAGLALQPVHQVEDDVEAASCTATDARSCDCHGEMRRAETLKLPEPWSGLGCGPVHLLVDSTGLRLCGPGEWLLEKHGTKR